MQQNNIERALAALHSIPADLERAEWIRVGMAAQAAGLDFDHWDAWSATGQNYTAAAARDAWKSFKPGRGIGEGTLFKIAAGHGWRMNGDKPRDKPPQVPRKAAEPPRKPIPGMSAAEVWGRCEQASDRHPYIERKQAAGVPLDNLRVVPTDDKLVILGERMAGSLVLPVNRADGSISTMQFITATDVAARLKASGKSDKPNLPGARMEGHHVVGEVLPGGKVYLCEGIATAWACWKATGDAAVCCFGWGRVRGVAADLRQRDASAHLVICPDRGMESTAEKIALEVGASVAYMPESEIMNFDACDLALRDGTDVLAELLERVGAPAAPELLLNVVFADSLPDAFTPADELVEGVLTAGDGSILYGDSNSGKTFFVIDMACAVARGVPWMGKQTEQGLVVYLAAESPASVRGRLQAYQNHHGVRVPNFAIVQSPIDLFDGEADTDKVVQLVLQLEKQTGQKARLIVGDTLARLSAGANENAGQDMGLVVRRFDRIRTECKAHFLLIHHSGKNAAAGSRGWSGIRAAVDTEIEVTDSPAGRCAEIMKQRDLATKGERIGFRLDGITLGLTKWGKPATSCVVVPVDAPERQVKGKRMGELEGAVLEFLAGHKIGIKKSGVVQHFEGRYEKGPIYRAMKALVTANAIHEAAGMVCITTAAK